MSAWSLEGGRLTLSSPKIKIWFEVPEDFEMPHAALLSLAEWLLFEHPKYEKVGDAVGGRDFGDNIGCDYSGGSDSMAAFELLPSAIPIQLQYESYIKRDLYENSSNAIRCYSPHKIIKTNIEKIGKEYGKKSIGLWGFSAFSVGAVLFADYYNLKTIASGYCIETHLNPRVNDKTLEVKKIIRDRYNKAGLHYAFPVSGLTEISTTKIALSSKASRFISYCIRGPGGTPCNRCVKCYRKGPLHGLLLPGDPPKSLKHFSKKKILVPHIWVWLQQGGVYNHAELEELKDYNVSWADKLYLPFFEADVPKYLQDSVKAKIQSYGIQTCSDPTLLSDWIIQK